MLPLTPRANRKKTVSVSAIQKASPLMIIGFLLPAILLVSVFSYYPAVDGIIMSFQKVRSRDLTTRAFYGFQNYLNVFKINEFWQYWGNTLRWTVGCVLLELFVGTSVALLLNRTFRGKRVVEGIVFIPWALSHFTVGVIFRWIFNGSCGIINDILRRLGLITVNIPFLASNTWAMPSVMIAKVWTGFAFFSIIIMASLKTIPQELYEAADIDGSNGWNKFRYITLPHLKTILVFGTLMRTIAAFNTSELIIALTGGGPAGATHTVASFIFTSMLQAKDYGKLAAFNVILWIVMQVITIAYFGLAKVMREGDA